MIFWRMWKTKQLLVHVDFDRRIKITEDQQLFVTNIIQNSVYVQQKKNSFRFKTKLSE